MSTAPMQDDFELLPAIDLRAGGVVRLSEGDFERETRYAAGPLAVAERFLAAGASWLHLVDLDGARAGGERQTALVQRIVEQVGGRALCQVAGGLRDEAAVARALDGGAARVVLGTAALRDATLVRRLVQAHGPARVVVAIDVRDGLAVGDGWVPGTPGVPADAAIPTLADAGVTRFAVTSIARDGRLAGPDIDLLERLAGLAPVILASGGIASLADLDAVRGAGCAGAIVGRAILEGRIDLAKAVRHVEGWASGGD